MTSNKFETRVLSFDDQEEMRDKLEDMGVEGRGVEIMSPKGEFRIVRASGINPKGANIIKQEFLAAGGEAAVSWEALNMSEEKSEIVMMGTLTQYRRVLKKLEEQPFDLPLLAEEIESCLNNYDRSPEIPWPGPDRQLMGVLNVTPDSFYDGGEYERVEDAVKRALEMVGEGAVIIDIGGESTRPGSERVSLEEELDRVIPVIEELSDEIDVPISIDTYKPEVVEEAVKAGADIVNDVYGLRQDGMPEKIAELDVPVIIMHMQGEPKNMQESPSYENVIDDISSFFLRRVEEAVSCGIDPDKIILDPGIGFGKRLEHNLEIIERLDEFTSFGFPILLGASRKSFLDQILDKGSDDRLYGSLAAASLAVKKGVSILRVHDVEETRDVLNTVEATEKL